MADSATAWESLRGPLPTACGSALRMADQNGGVHAVTAWDLIVLLALGYLLVHGKRWLDACMTQAPTKNVSAAKHE